MLFALVAAAPGLALGSFAVTAGLRSAQGTSVLQGRSRCDGCGVPLGFLATIPVVSHLRLGGRCASCGASIDRLHMVGEITGAVACASAVLAAPWPRAAAVATLGITLIFLSSADWRAKRLPDMGVLMVAVIGLALALDAGSVAAATGVVAAAATFALLLAVRTAARTREGAPGLGLGDVKLLAALALWTGWVTPWLVLLAAVLGLGAMALTRPADGRLPFGPVIAAAGWLVGLGGEAQLWPTTV